MLRCFELGLRREDLLEMSMGMVYDLLIEKENDNEKYPIKGTSLKDFLDRGGRVG